MSLKMKNKQNLCENCKINSGKKLHTCPFKIDIYDDSKTLCNCCDKCMAECINDI
jgi:hypothetical protein